MLSPKIIVAVRQNKFCEKSWSWMKNRYIIGERGWAILVSGTILIICVSNPRNQIEIKE